MCPSNELSGNGDAGPEIPGPQVTNTITIQANQQQEKKHGRERPLSKHLSPPSSSVAGNGSEQGSGRRGDAGALGTGTPLPNFRPRGKQKPSAPGERLFNSQPLGSGSGDSRSSRYLGRRSALAVIPAVDRWIAGEGGSLGLVGEATGLESARIRDPSSPTARES